MRPSAARSSVPSSWITSSPNAPRIEASAGSPGSHDLAGERVRVDDGGAERGEAGRDRRLAGRDAAGERDESHGSSLGPGSAADGVALPCAAPPISWEDFYLP